MRTEFPATDNALQRAAPSDHTPVAITVTGPQAQRALVAVRDSGIAPDPIEERVAERRAAWPNGVHLKFTRTRFIPNVNIAQASRVLGNLAHFSDDQFHKQMMNPGKIPAAVEVKFDMDHTNWPLLPLHDHALVRGICTRWNPPSAKDPNCFQTLLEVHVKGAPTPDHEQAVRIRPVDGGVELTWRVSSKPLEKKLSTFTRAILRRWVGWQMARAIERKINLFEARVVREERGGKNVRGWLERFYNEHIKRCVSYTAPVLLDKAPPPMFGPRPLRDLLEA